MTGFQDPVSSHNLAEKRYYLKDYIYILELDCKPSFEDKKSKQNSTQNLLCELPALTRHIEFTSNVNLGCLSLCQTDRSEISWNTRKNEKFCDQTGPTNKNGSYHLWFLFQIPNISEEKEGN